MDIVDPRVPPSLVPPGSRATVIAKDQPEYRALPSIRTPDGQVITRWSFTDEERRAILRGEDLYITLMTFGPINPLLPTVGLIDWNRSRPAITVSAIDGRQIELSCGHRFEIHLAFGLPSVGDEAFCPFCGRK